MPLLSKEHYELMDMFEKNIKSCQHLGSHRLDREESTDLWAKGRIYQSGETNSLFIAFRLGAAYGEAISR